MKFAELGSSGACETSAFHQLLRGNSGKGPGSAPFNVAAAVITVSASSAHTTAAENREPLCDQIFTPLA
jgi:hypothetical protein